MTLLRAELVHDHNAVEEPMRGPTRYRAELWIGDAATGRSESWDLLADSVVDAVAWINEQVAQHSPCRGVLSLSHALTAGGTAAPNPIATHRIYEVRDGAEPEREAEEPAPFRLRAVPNAY